MELFHIVLHFQLSALNTTERKPTFFTAQTDVFARARVCLCSDGAVAGRY